MVVSCWARPRAQCSACVVWCGRGSCWVGMWWKVVRSLEVRAMLCSVGLTKAVGVGVWCDTVGDLERVGDLCCARTAGELWGWLRR